MRAGSLRVALAPLLLSCALLPSGVVRAQDAADEAFDAGRLDEATGRYGRELESGRLDAERLAHVHRRLAELAALASLEDEATRHLTYALAIEPDAELSEALTARETPRPAGRVRVVLGVSSETDPIEIAVRDAPEGLVRTLAVQGSDGHARALPWDGQARVLDVPAAARPIEVRALDQHGNVVAHVGRVELPAPEPEPEPEPDPVPLEEPEPEEGDGDDGLVESPWLWIAVGLVVVGVGVAIGVSASGERFVVGAPEVR